MDLPVNTAQGQEGPVTGLFSYEPPGPPYTYQNQDLDQETLVVGPYCLSKKRKNLTTISTWA